MLAQRLLSPPVAQRPGISPTTKIRSRMAEVMRIRAAGGGACTDSDLIAAGFSPEQVAAHAAAAAAIAAARSVRPAGAR